MDTVRSLHRVVTLVNNLAAAIQKAGGSSEELFGLISVDAQKRTLDQLGSFLAGTIREVGGMLILSFPRDVFSWEVLRIFFA